MELQGSESDRRHAQVICRLERSREIPLQTPSVGVAGIRRLRCAALGMTRSLKTCGTTNKEKRRPGNPWASAVG